jgi:hypothetical protein
MRVCLASIPYSFLIGSLRSPYRIVYCGVHTRHRRTGYCYSLLPILCSGERSDGYFTLVASCAIGVRQDGGSMHLQGWTVIKISGGASCRGGMAKSGVF